MIADALGMTTNALGMTADALWITADVLGMTTDALGDNCRCLGDDCRCPWQCADTWYMSYYVMIRHPEYQKTKNITFKIIPIKHSIIL